MDDPLKPIADAVEDAIRDAETREAFTREDHVAAPEAGAAEPRTMGFSVETINRDHALVLMGSKAVVVKELRTGPIDDRQRVLTLEAFSAWYSNKFTEIRDPHGKVKTVNWAIAWLRNPHRLSYSGIEFFPNPDDAEATPGYLNLWRGFAFGPTPKPHGWKTLRDHLLANVCHGDEALFDWVFGFFAHMVQRPRERIGVALVLRGAMGSGKTVVGEHFGALIPHHYFLVDDPRYVTGQFNAHMASCLLLQADEAVWAGDKAAEGRLKGLITSPIQQIEAKGVDPIRLRNYVRLVMTSNESWVVPAGQDERQFAVLDVDRRCVGNHGYFGEMAAELREGGYAALLADLLAFDLECVDLRTIPRTAALLEQKERSLDPIKAWWLDRLESGETRRQRPASKPRWENAVPCNAVVDDFIAHAERVGSKRRAEETVLARELRRLVPGLERKRGTDDDGCRIYNWHFPPLTACRSAWDDAMGQRRDWPDEENDEDDRNMSGEREDGSRDF